AQSLPQPTGTEEQAVSVPLNLIPHIRVAVADQIANPTDRITMDVIALLFDYVFRDPSIPDDMRELFGRLQVPIVKAALLDRAFFADRNHPARRLLDQLAEGAVGANSNDVYKEQFTSTAAGIIDEVCRDFEVDVTVFEAAATKLTRFVEAERRETTAAIKPDVDEALQAENREKDHAEVQAQVRDRLAGLTVPFEIRSFAETIWTDYVTRLRVEHGPDSAPVETALRTLDDMLWSIVAKERTAQKARLTKMIPALVSGLRRAVTLLQVPAERATRFFDTLYGLHIAAIKPPPERKVAKPDGAAAGAQDTGEPTVPQGPPTVSPPPINVHDYVSEMAPGTWLRFETDRGALNARLSWISPLRTKYIFTSRSRSRAVVYSPEELAYALGAGRAALIVEPVPLFDRAVSAALDTLAARTPPPGSDGGPLTLQRASA
ncbi:MAG TPA: DUF1631 family protein, partial [Casimicrobiaceae bacterium]|nr:DUF1631 family protein [Casimicrobiaceae bacterium]